MTSNNGRDLSQEGRDTSKWPSGWNDRGSPYFMPPDVAAYYRVSEARDEQVRRAAREHYTDELIEADDGYMVSTFHGLPLAVRPWTGPGLALHVHLSRIADARAELRLASSRQAERAERERVTCDCCRCVGNDVAAKVIPGVQPQIPRSGAVKVCNTCQVGLAVEFWNRQTASWLGVDTTDVGDGETYGDKVGAFLSRHQTGTLTTVNPSKGQRR